MIQRIQSIYLLLIAILTSLLFFYPYQVNLTYSPEIQKIQLSFSTDNNLLLIASIIGIIIPIDALASIFLYKNRRFQMISCHYLSLMNFVLLILMYFGASDAGDLPLYKLPYIIPIVNIVLAQSARYFIKKDDDLVKSADRIR